MKLFECAFACRLYGPFGDYDSSLNELCKTTDPALDVQDAGHRHALFIWLRKWGCRQFAEKYEGMAGRALLAWANSFLPALPPVDLPLLRLSRAAIKEVADAYDDLRGRRASQQARRLGPCRMSFGPAGAAKVFFALRPISLPPWDDAIRTGLGYDESKLSYARFLVDAKRHLEELLEDATRFGITPKNLPSVLGRPESSLAKLVDEYLWVTITNECACPDRGELERWLRWGAVVS